jgi:hypothetical protein
MIQDRVHVPDNTGLLRALGILSALFVVGPALAQRPNHTGQSAISFRQTRPNQQVIVSFATQGCFHKARYRLQFRGFPTPKVDVYWEDGWTTTRKKGERIGSVRLSNAQLDRLDNLLRFYRGARGNGCTTVEHARFDLIEKGHVVHSEAFTDSSGMLDLLPVVYKELKLQDPEALSLSELVTLSKAKDKRGEPKP